MERKVLAAVRQYADSDAFLFTSYSMSSKKYSDKPSVLFCDWTAEYDLLHAHGRKIEELPSYDVRFMQRQKEVIEGADAVVCLFPGVTEHMRKVYPQARIHYIGNVVNSLEEPVVCGGDGSFGRECRDGGHLLLSGLPGNFRAAVPYAGFAGDNRVARCKSVVCVAGSSCDLSGRTAGSGRRPDPLIVRKARNHMKRMLQIFADSGNNFNFGPQYR